MVAAPMRRPIALAFLSFCIAAHGACDEPKGASSVASLPRAHAHNDYAHRRPLLDALDQGFCNVEADVFLVGDRLLVAHSVFELNAKRTLEALYLEPLAKRVKESGGKVHADGAPFTLMIDLKTEAEPTYRALAKALARHAEMLSEVRDGKFTPRAVSVVLSGNRPSETVAGETLRYAGLDGRIGDLRSDAPAHLIPWISDSWSNHFKWDGRGAMPEEERAKLERFVKAAHSKERKIRFWGAPDVEPAWQTLEEAGVDLINTDKLSGLAAFLRAKSAPKQSAN